MGAGGRVAALVSIAVIAALPGCAGSEADDPDGPTVSLRVTREFGREVLLEEDRAPLPRPATVLALLRDHTDVRTSHYGLAISSIDGVRSVQDGDDTSTWALIVNGIEADELPRRYRIHPGDVVQLDLRDWYVTLDVRATVGAFPQTFTRGVFGRRFPVTVECAEPAATACKRVRRALRRAGVSPDGAPPRSAPPPPGEPRRARVLVGPWEHWHRRPWPRRIDRGPRYSGVFARFDSAAATLRLLDWEDEHVSVEGAGTGLVAAMRPTEEDLVWVVTGVDDEGVERAAGALNAHDLRDAFAVVVRADGVERIPLPPGGGIAP